MCAIGGFISSQPLEPALAQRICQALLFYGEDRGHQSSGIFINNQLLKKAQPAKTFIFRDDFQQLFAQPATMAILHNRQPTMGSLEDDGAHPFQFGSTTCVHNGCIINAPEVRKKLNLEKPSGVDSELFASAIELLGIARLPQAVSEMQGSAAIAFIQDGQLYLARDTSPCEYFTLRDGDVDITIFGSTEEQVMRAVRFNWLFSYQRTTTLEREQIFPMAATGPQPTIGTFRTRSWSSSHSGSHVTRGGFRMGGRWHDWEEENYGGYTPSGAQSTSSQQPLCLPLPPVPGIKPIAAIDDPAVEPPCKLGFGFIPIWNNKTIKLEYHYDRTYGEKQRIKYPTALKGGSGGKKDRDRNKPAAGHKAAR